MFKDDLVMIEQMHISCKKKNVDQDLKKKIVKIGHFTILEIVTSKSFGHDFSCDLKVNFDATCHEHMLGHACI